MEERRALIEGSVGGGEWIESLPKEGAWEWVREGPLFHRVFGAA